MKFGMVRVKLSVLRNIRMFPPVTNDEIANSGKNDKNLMLNSRSIRSWIREGR